MNGVKAMVVALMVSVSAAQNTTRCDDDDDEEVRYNELNSMLLLILFFVGTWLAGKGAMTCGMPGLVGEIACGAQCRNQV